MTFSATRAGSAPAHSEGAIAQTSPGETTAPSPLAPGETGAFDPADDPGEGESRVFAEPLAETEPLAEADPLPDEGLPGENDPIDDPLEEDESLDDPYSDDDPYLDDDPYADDDDIDDDDGDKVLVRADPAIARPRHRAPGSSRRAPAEPRPGFFARLFGRARRTFPEPRVPRETVQLPAYEPNEDIADQLPPPELPSSMAMAEQVTLSYEDVGALPPASDLHAEPLPSELAELDAATLARAHAAEQAGAGDAGEIAEPAGTQVVPAQSGQLAAAPVEPAPAQTDAPGDIAGELRTAEETAAGRVAAEQVADEQVADEQVKAVLTSALDRLGSAHHRPFSRA